MGYGAKDGHWCFFRYMQLNMSQKWQKVRAYLPK